MKHLLKLAIVLIIAITFSGSGFADENWNFKVSLIKHQLVIKPGSPDAWYDGKPFATTPAMLKDNRLYLPLRLMRELSQVTWNTKDNYVDVTVPEQKSYLRYQVNKPFVSFMNEEGIAVYQIPVPAPFIKNGIFYIPVKSLDQALGTNLSYTDNKLTISWDIPVIDQPHIPAQVEDDAQTLIALYEVGLDVPSVIQGENSWLSPSWDSSEKQELSIEGKKFFQQKLTLPLKPGDNPFYLWVRKGNFQREEPFVIRREVRDGEIVPISYGSGSPINQSSRENFEITEPKSGYVRLALPGTLNFKGYLKGTSFGDNIFRLIITKLDGYMYRQYDQIQIPVVKGQLSAQVNLPDPGAYLLEVISPQYIPTTEQGTVGTKWAEIKVEVGDRADGAFSARLAGTGIGLKDLNDLIIIDGHFLDLNQDGRKDEIYFVANPYDENDDYFSAPGYLIYATSAQEKFRYIKLDFPPIDLHKGNINIQYGDIDQDSVPEIFYSVDYPQPEYVTRWPHMLQYHRETGEFSDFDITSEYDMIADWGVEDNHISGEAELWLDIKRELYDNEGIRRYFHLYQGRLIKRENYFRLVNPSLSHEHDPIITFSDRNLEEVVRKEIDQEKGPIYQSELKGITYLSAPGKMISNLKGLESLVDLRELNLSQNSIHDLGPLKNLVNLEELYLSGNEIQDLSPLQELQKLRVLHLADCGMRNIETLGGMPNLFHLDLSHNSLTDIGPLAKLRTLQGLSLENNQIEQVKALAQLTSLLSLGLQDNRISDVSPLKGLANLEWFGVQGNEVSDLSILSTLKGTYIY
ncbi:leucine-rich repeat domain-containing protein [Candidatus Formimonas warabiya]|uniref:Copper amine oxidase-like N-terminal domain-containing protein n=1 Tax=Formimonas warabiya TaxID=1761012 RepID=A0A3G1L0P0_FORW1|nr:leucine-rich repeat domain-containing protein [Candidatus Formimonas warabiya]ATW28230.1 hypothetical protein DCMF_28830 [Candidatus Formimonas warabiya]